MMILAGIGMIYAVAAVLGLLCFVAWINTPMEYEHGLDGEKPYDET